MQAWVWLVCLLVCVIGSVAGAPGCALYNKCVLGEAVQR
jgi:hypothetical protein